MGQAINDDVSETALLFEQYSVDARLLRGLTVLHV